MSETKRTYNYNLLTNSVPTHNFFIKTDVNLLEMYKAALLSGLETIAWEKGVINIRQIVAIIDNSID